MGPVIAKRSRSEQLPAAPTVTASLDGFAITKLSKSNLFLGKKILSIREIKNRKVNKLLCLLIIIMYLIMDALCFR